jgi:hypothetical protein
VNISYTRNNGQFAIRLNTVNVIETVDGVPQSLRSFIDNPEGNARAEKLFKRLVKEHNKEGGPKFSDEDFTDMMDDGVYDDDCGYCLFITHSL